MLPIRDNAPPERRSVVVGLLIALSLGIFALELLNWQGPDGPFGGWALVPSWLTHPGTWASQSPGPPLTLVLSLVPHASAAQLAVNLLYLVIFADVVEAVYGRLAFVCLYVVGGSLAGLAHASASANSAVPVLGAAGAVSAVLGAYCVLHPTRHVTCLTVCGPMRMPAWLFLAAWLALQGSGVLKGEHAEGVAWYGQAVAFVFGLGLTRVLVPAHLRPRPAAAAVYDYFARNQAAPPHRLVHGPGASAGSRDGRAYRGA